MAIANNGINGPFSGKIGPIVGTTWRGKPVMRSAPSPSSKPATAAQVLQRAKFKTVMAFLHPAKPFLLQWFGKMENSKSPFDLALSYHLKEAIKQEGDTLMLQYPKVCLSKGHLRSMENTAIQLQQENILQLVWGDNSDQSFAKADDILTLILYTPVDTTFYFFENVALRKDTSTQFTLPIEAVGKRIHCWGTFVNLEGTEAATSTYVGGI